MNLKEDVVAGFLRKFKKIATERGIDIVPRRKNMEDLTSLGLTKKTAFRKF